MNLVIRPLTMDDTIPYLNFFDREDHSDDLQEHKCYCVCWSSDDHRQGLERMSTASKRRDLAAQYVQAGMIRGYLALDENRVVGWCNANARSEYTHSISWMRNLKELTTSNSEDQSVKSIFCFAIAKEYRRRGIATKLLEQVCKEAFREGYQYVEAYPKSSLKEKDDFEGPLTMYLKQGFFIKEDFGHYLVVRKQLH